MPFPYVIFSALGISPFRTIATLKSPAEAPHRRRRIRKEKETNGYPKQYHADFLLSFISFPYLFAVTF